MLYQHCAVVLVAHDFYQNLWVHCANVIGNIIVMILVRSLFAAIFFAVFFAAPFVFCPWSLVVNYAVTMAAWWDLGFLRKTWVPGFWKEI